MTVNGIADLENNSAEAFNLVGTIAIRGTSDLNGTYSLETINAIFGSFAYYSPVPNASMGQELYMSCNWQTNSVAVTRTVLVIYDGTTTANPCAEVVLEGNKLVVYVYTGAGRAGAESDTGSTVIVANDKYHLEFSYIRTNGNSRGYVELRLAAMGSSSGSAEASKEHSSSVGYNALVYACFGRTRHIAFGGATHDFDDLWVNNGSGAKNTSWPGNLAMARIRANADGNYKTYRGVPDDTDHYTNVDEVAVSDADFVVDDKISGNNKETFELETIASGKTIRAIKTMVRRKALNATATASALVVRESSTDYTKDIDNTGDDIGSWEYAPYVTLAGDQGPQYWDTLPSGGDLTNAAVSALEIGGYSNKDSGKIDQDVPTADVAGGIDWDTTDGGGVHYTEIDENTAGVDDGDYVESDAADEFDRYAIAAPADNEGYLYGSGFDPVHCLVRARTDGADATVDVYITFDSPPTAGGTWHQCDSSITVSGGAFTYYRAGWALDPRDSGTWYNSDAPAITGFGIYHVDGDSTVQVSLAQLNIPAQPTLRISQASILVVYDDQDEPGVGGSVKKISTIEWASVKKASTIVEASIKKVSTIEAN